MTLTILRGAAVSEFLKGDRGKTDGSKDCECHACIVEFDKKLYPDSTDPFWSRLLLSAGKMILCGECGNKRCPHASNHRQACTGSNEPGQKGSIYE